MIDYKDSLLLTRPTIATMLPFIRKFFPYHVAEHCRIGNGSIYYGSNDYEDNVYASYKFDEDGTWLPIFESTPGRAVNDTHSNYREAFEELIGSWGLFDRKDKAEKYLGRIKYRLPLSNDTREYSVGFNIAEGKIRLESQYKDEFVNYFGLGKGSIYPIEREVYARCQAYLACSSGFSKK